MVNYNLQMNNSCVLIENQLKWYRVSEIVQNSDNVKRGLLPAQSMAISIEIITQSK